MAPDLALVAFYDGGGIGHMIEMAMGEEEKVDVGIFKLFIRPLRSIKKDVLASCFVEKTVGIEDAPRKGFELIHGKVV